METRLIMLDNPILVSDETATDGDLVVYSSYTPLKLRNNNLYSLSGDWICLPNQNSEFQPYKKIIAGLPDLPRLDLSLIAEEIGWVDVLKLTESFINNRPNRTSLEHDLLLGIGFIEGFRVAQSLNEKKYSEEDMIEFAHFCRDYFTHLLTINEKFNLWLSNRKPKEYLVEVEMEVNQCDGCISGHHIIDGIHKAPYPSGSMVCKKHLYDRPKITNNSIKVTKVI